MAGKSTVQWLVTASADIDGELRSHLGERGVTDRDISKFVEDAVKWRLFDLHLAEARAGVRSLSPDDLDSLIDEAVVETRRSESPTTG